jgi:hypothetical protein
MAYINRALGTSSFFPYFPLHIPIPNMPAFNNTNVSVSTPTVTSTLVETTSHHPVPTTVQPTGSLGVPWSASSQHPQIFARDNEAPKDNGWSPGYPKSYREDVGPMIAMSIQHVDSICPTWGKSLVTSISKAAQSESYVDLTAAVQGLYGGTQPHENCTQWDSQEQETMLFRIQSVDADWKNPNGPYWLGIKYVGPAIEPSLRIDPIGHLLEVSPAPLTPTAPSSRTTTPPSLPGMVKCSSQAPANWDFQVNNSSLGQSNI